MKSISITDLDAAKDVIFSAISEIESSTDDSDKKLLIKLKNSTGSVPTGIGITSRLINSKVDLYIEAEGVINPAGTIISAAGVPLGRTASFTTVFQLSKSGKKLGKGNLKENDDKLLLALLAKYTSKKGTVLKLMQQSGTITSKEAESLGIIDNVSNYVDKYADMKKKLKEANRGRGRKPKDTSDSGQNKMALIPAATGLSASEQKSLAKEVEDKIDTSEASD